MKLKIGALSTLLLLAGCWEQTTDQAEPTDSSKTVEQSHKNPYDSASRSKNPYVKTAMTGSEKERLTSTFYFDYDSCKIDEVNQKLLKAVAMYLKNNPSEHITITGHTDTKGSFKYNQDLGLRRANAVAEYLESLGVSKTQLDVASKGKEEPVSTESNDTAQAMNRRVNITFAEMSHAMPSSEISLSSEKMSSTMPSDNTKAVPAEPQPQTEPSKETPAKMTGHMTTADNKEMPSTEKDTNDTINMRKNRTKKGKSS